MQRTQGSMHIDENLCEIQRTFNKYELCKHKRATAKLQSFKLRIRFEPLFRAPWRVCGGAMQRMVRSSARSALVNWAFRFESKHLLQHDLQHRIPQMTYAILARNPMDRKASLKSVKNTTPRDESKVLDEYFYHNGEMVMCFCGVAALQKIAGPTSSKPGFRYLTCPNSIPWYMKMRNVPSKGPSCHFFRWVDPSGVMLEATKSTREMKAEKAVKKKKLTCFTKSSSGCSEAKVITSIQKPETETEGTSKETKGKKKKTGSKVSNTKGAEVKDELSEDSKLQEVEQKEVATVQGPIAASDDIVTENSSMSVCGTPDVETEKQVEGGSLSGGADVKKPPKKASLSSKNKGSTGEADPTVSLDSISNVNTPTSDAKKKGCTSVKTKASTSNGKVSYDDAEASLERTKAESVSTPATSNTFSEPVKKASPAVKAKGTRASALKEEKPCEAHDLNEPLSLDSMKAMNSLQVSASMVDASSEIVEVKDVLKTANSSPSKNKPSEAGSNKGAVDLPTSAVKELAYSASSASKNISALCTLDTVGNGFESDLDKNVSPVGNTSLSGNMVEDEKNSQRSFGNTQVKPLCACKVSKPAVMKNVWFEPVGKVLRYWSCANHEATKMGCLFFRWIDDPMVPEKLSKAAQAKY